MSARRRDPRGPRAGGLATDFADRWVSGPSGSRLVAALVSGLLLGALILVALRIDIIRMRYAVAQALERETEQRGRQREFVVESRKLRQPGRLAEIAAELGYERPTRLVQLPAREPAADGPTLSSEPSDWQALAARSEVRP
ncbi:MAG: hypothetical protein ACQGVK_24100 [Myxococcota bacterium]